MDIHLIIQFSTAHLFDPVAKPPATVQEEEYAQILRL